MTTVLTQNEIAWMDQQAQLRQWATGDKNPILRHWLDDKGAVVEGSPEHRAMYANGGRRLPNPPAKAINARTYLATRGNLAPLGRAMCKHFGIDPKKVTFQYGDLPDGVEGRTEAAVGGPCDVKVKGEGSAADTVETVIHEMAHVIEWHTGRDALDHGRDFVDAAEWVADYFGITGPSHPRGMSAAQLRRWPEFDWSQAPAVTASGRPLPRIQSLPIGPVQGREADYGEQLMRKQMETSATYNPGRLLDQGSSDCADRRFVLTKYVSRAMADNVLADKLIKGFTSPTHYLGLPAGVVLRIDADAADVVNPTAPSKHAAKLVRDMYAQADGPAGAKRVLDYFGLEQPKTPLPANWPKPKDFLPK